MKLESFGISKLKSISKEFTLDFKPLTFFIGCNSTGKSTLLRSLPLIKQSIEAYKQGPILWFGRLVDFGSFKTSITKHSTSNDLSLSFLLRGEPGDSHSFKKDQIANYLVKNSDFFKVSLNIRQHNESNGCYIKYILLSTSYFNAKLIFSDKGHMESISINDFSISSNDAPAFILYSDNLFTITHMHTTISPSGNRVSIFTHALQNLINSSFPNADPSNLFFNLSTFTAMPRPYLGEHIARHMHGSNSSDPPPSEPLLDQIYALMMAPITCRILNSVNNELSSIFSNLTYIAPYRAPSERFSRFQELAVTEVDPTGSNVAMFIMSMPESERTQFSHWLEEHFGLRLKLESTNLHNSLLISDSNSGAFFNISDMGYGYSQVLPILTSLWPTTPRTAEIKEVIPTKPASQMLEEQTNNQNIVAIEQPELHLHPRFQAKFIDLICNVIKNEKSTSAYHNFICETHSETIINRVGTLINRNKISKDDVQILIFEKDTETQNTIIKTSYFDENGALQDWPYGFFLPMDE